VHAPTGAAHCVTYPGFIDKTPCLKTLRATAVALMPVQRFFRNELVASGNGY